MSLPRFSRRRAKPAPAGSQRYRHPLDAVPLRPDGVELAKRLEDGSVIMRRTLAPRTRLGRALARWVPARRSVHVQLDARGALFWDLVDGETPLARIAERVARKLELDRETARQCVLLFARDLMTRGFLQLKVDPDV